MGCIKPERPFIMKKFLTQNIYWIGSHAAAVIMAGMLIIDPGAWKVLTSYSGYTAVGFLVATLLLTPLKTLRPQWMFITKLNRHRRELGVAAFSYAVIHIACFIIKRGGFMNALPYALHPASSFRNLHIFSYISCFWPLRAISIASKDWDSQNGKNCIRKFIGQKGGSSFI